MGASWAPNCPKRVPRVKMNSKTKHFHPTLGCQVGAKIEPKSILGRSKRLSFFVSLFGSTFEASWCQLGSNLAPKALPKWSQVGCKIDIKCTSKLHGFRTSFWVGSWMLLGSFSEALWRPKSTPRASIRENAGNKNIRKKTHNVFRGSEGVQHRQQIYQKATHKRLQDGGTAT